MKKLLITTLTLMSVLPITLLGDDDIVREIDLKSIDVRTRSIVEVPEASISHEVLRVSFSSSGIYSVTVSDSMGSPVYISSLPADGLEYSYDLSGIGEGTFTLTLEGPSGEYEGVFCIQ